LRPGIERAVHPARIDRVDRSRARAPPGSLGGGRPQNYDRVDGLSTRRPTATRRLP
jgi:hypothetical protein